MVYKIIRKRVDQSEDVSNRFLRTHQTPRSRWGHQEPRVSHLISSNVLVRATFPGWWHRDILFKNKRANSWREGSTLSLQGMTKIKVLFLQGWFVHNLHLGLHSGQNSPDCFGMSTNQKQTQIGGIKIAHPLNHFTSEIWTETHTSVHEAYF